MPEHGSRTSESHAIFQEDREYDQGVLPLLEPIVEAAGQPTMLPPGSDAHGLLRIVMDYVGRTRSSRLSAAWATAIGLVDHLSHVLLLTLLKCNGDWFERLAKLSLEHCNEALPLEPFIQDRPLVAMDGSWVNSDQAPDGERGELVHLMFELATGWLRQFHLPLERRDGESLTHFQLEPGMIVLVDRLYCSAKSILYAKDAGADVIVRWRRNISLFVDEQTKALFDWRAALEALEPGHRLERRVWLQRSDGQRVQVRCVAQEMGREFADKQIEQARRNKVELTDELRRYARYLVVLTTLDAEEFSAEQSIELYHQRWSTAEISIRELKSVMGFKHVIGKTARKRRAWLFCQLLLRGLLQLFDADELRQTRPLSMSMSSRGDEQAEPGQLRARTDIDRNHYRPGLLKAALMQALMPMRLSWWRRVARRFLDALPRERRRKRPRSIAALLRKLVPAEEFERWATAT